jgi:hypothetical protein
MDFFMWMVELLGFVAKARMRSEEAETVATPADGPMIPPWG